MRGYIEQLVAEGLLAREGDPYPVLRLTAAGVALLKGDGECTLYREIVPPGAKGKLRRAHGASGRRRRSRAVRRRCATCACGWRASAACRRT